MSKRPQDTEQGQAPALAQPIRVEDTESRNAPTAAEHEAKQEEVQAAFPPTGGGGRGSRGGGDGGRGGNGDDLPKSPDGSPENPIYTVTALTRSDDPALELHEQALWKVIAATSRATAFGVYADFLDCFFDHPIDGDEPFTLGRTKRNSAIRRPVSAYGLDAWELVNSATEIFLKHQAGALSDVVRLTEPPKLIQPPVPPFNETPEGRRSADLRDQRRNFELQLTQSLAGPRLTTYLELIRRKLSELPTVDQYILSTDQIGIFRDRIESPLLVELIWSYWMEQGMLVQTMNAIALRFQNIATPKLSNALQNLAVDHLRPLSNLLWGYVQYEGNRLSVPRRAYEYAHAYGLDLMGKAVQTVRTVERRSRFLEAFHSLLHACTAFYKEHDDLTVKADGFPLLNAITEVHLLLAEGAHNQFNDLPWTARAEMMSMQWLLARPEFREFLGGRIGVPYPEPWMDRVDTMKSLQGWTDTSITSFYWLATCAEQILLSIRYGNWSLINSGALAVKWAEQWRPEVQKYVHQYRQVTGVDLSVAPTEQAASVRFAQPSLLIARRVASQRLHGLEQAPAIEAPRRPTTLPSPLTANQIGTSLQRPVLSLRNR